MKRLIMSQLDIKCNLNDVLERVNAAYKAQTQVNNLNTTDFINVDLHFLT